MRETTSGRRRNLLKLNTHFVWATKDRLSLIDDASERRLYRYMVSVFQRLESTVLAIGGIPDHVHVLAALSPKYGVSEVVKNVKGSSSRFFSQTLKPESWFQWQPNYAAINVSPSDVESVRRYILSQKAHHAAGSLWPEYEATDEPDEDDAVFEGPEPYEWVADSEVE